MKEIAQGMRAFRGRILAAMSVRDVMVNGRMVVSDSQALTINAKQVLAKAEEFGAKVRESLKR